MANILRLLPTSIFKQLEDEATVSVVLALQRNGKVVTTATARSVRSGTEFSSSTSIANIGTIGGGGLPFFTRPKPANTKLPVKKVGDSFQLFPGLKAWKAATGFGGSDFLLARAIAKNPRPAIDIATPAKAIFLKRTEGILPKALARLLAEEIKEDFDERQNQ